MFSMYTLTKVTSADHGSNDIYDKFAEMLTEKVKQFKVGPGFEEGV